MKLIRQDFDTKVCGHCCVAMILNITLEKAIKLIGHENGTAALELTKALGIKKNFIRFSKKAILPEKAILYVGHPEDKRHRHWIVINKGKIYCPSFGLFDTLENYLIFSENRVTSILKLN